MSKQTRKQPTGKTITYLDTNPLWVQYFGEGGTGLWSAKYLKKARALCPNPDIVLDVGANIGQTAAYYADWAKEVWSFEPLPHLYDIVVENVNQNNQANVKVFNKAVGDVHTTLKMKSVASNDGASFVTTKDSPGLVAVEAITLDSLTIPDGRRVDYIKMDIEGYEPMALLGAVNLIKKYRPIVQLEVVDGHLSRVDWDSVKVVKFMEALGYKAQLSGGRPVDSNNETGRDWRGDIFFLP
jgi:FkbM family methyltransferase